MGLLIAIEGGDGSGKGTQSTIICDYIKNTLRLKAIKFSFPRYDNPAARYAGRYLDGLYGEANDIHPELGILPFAIDRLTASKEISAQISKPDTVVVLDRYMASNLAHQGTKIDSQSKRHRFYEETMELEYETLGIPRPDKNIVLLVPSTIAQVNVDKKDQDTRLYTDKRRDIHEADSNHLEKAKSNYEELCRLYPSEYTALDCMEKDGVSQRTIESVQEEIRMILKSLL